jgi:hypothetical protein
VARRTYRPEPAELKVQFYRAQTRPHVRPTPWDGIAELGVDLRQIVGSDINHERMMREPYVKMLAAQLTRDLRNEGSEMFVANGGARRSAAVD